jgi:hypothetical protein
MIAMKYFIVANAGMLVKFAHLWDLLELMHHIVLVLQQVQIFQCIALLTALYHLRNFISKYIEF